MKIERFEVPGLAQYGYIVSDGGECIVIDPMRDFDRYTAYAAEHGLRIKYVTETHIHADFASGARALAEATGAELALSAHDVGEQYSYTVERSRPVNSSAGWKVERPFSTFAGRSRSAAPIFPVRFISELRETSRFGRDGCSDPRTACCW